MFVHINTGHFEIIVGTKTNLFTFDYKTPEDFLYYILFTAEQLNLNPKLPIELIGILIPKVIISNYAYNTFATFPH
jgi:hypothetical protein